MVVGMGIQNVAGFFLPYQKSFFNLKKKDMGSLN